MNILYRSICLAALVLVSFSAGAAKLVVSQGTASCEFQLASGDAVSINPVTGDVSAIVTNLEDCMGPPELPSITSFTATSSVTPGGTIQLSWNTQDATSCQAVTTGVTNPLPGWSGSKAVPSGSQSITAPSPTTTPTTYRARLECSNSDGAVQETRTITVDEESQPVGCPNRPEPTGMSPATNGRQTTGAYPPTFCSGCGTTWSGMFDFNFAKANESWYYQEPDTFHAIEFSTGALPADESGFFDINEPHNFAIGANVRLGRKFISISECPGDFHASELGQGCYKVNTGTQNNVRWQGAAGTDPFACTLEPNKTYYLNIVHTSSPAGDPNPTWSCSGNDLGPNLRGCGMLLQPRGSDHDSGL